MRDLKEYLITLDALAGAGDDRYRSRLPSDTSSVVTVRAAAPMTAVSPLKASGHIAANISSGCRIKY